MMQARRLLGIAALVLLCAVGGVRAQQNPFVGTWMATSYASGSPTSIQTVMLPDGTFSQLTMAPSGAAMLQITGTYRIIDGNTIQLVATDFSPREQCGPGPGNRTVCFPLHLPPAETQTYQFQDANTLYLRSILMPNSPPTVFHRVR